VGHGWRWVCAARRPDIRIVLTLRNNLFLCEVSVALISKEKQKHGHKEKESTKCAALVVVVQFKIAVT